MVKKILKHIAKQIIQEYLVSLSLWLWEDAFSNKLLFSLVDGLEQFITGFMGSLSWIAIICRTYRDSLHTNTFPKEMLLMESLIYSWSPGSRSCDPFLWCLFGMTLTLDARGKYMNPFFLFLLEKTLCGLQCMWSRNYSTSDMHITEVIFLR